MHASYKIGKFFGTVCNSMYEKCTCTYIYVDQISQTLWSTSWDLMLSAFTMAAGLLISDNIDPHNPYSLLVKPTSITKHTLRKR